MYQKTKVVGHPSASVQRTENQPKANKLLTAQYISANITEYNAKKDQNTPVHYLGKKIVSRLF